METETIYAEFAETLKNAPDGPETSAQWLRKLEFLDTLQVGLASICCRELGENQNPVTEASRLAAYISLSDILQIIRSKAGNKALDAIYKRVEWAEVNGGEVAMLHYDDIDDIQSRLPALIDKIDDVLTKGNPDGDGFQEEVALLLCAFLEEKRESIAEVTVESLGGAGSQ